MEHVVCRPILISQNKTLVASNLSVCHVLFDGFEHCRELPQARSAFVGGHNGARVNGRAG